MPKLTAAGIIPTFLLLIACYLTLTQLQLEDFAKDPGLGWHITSGEFVLQHNTAPRIDPFLASPTPRPWVSDQWLSDAVLAKLYAKGSWPLLYSGGIFIFLITFCLLLFPLLVKQTDDALASAIATFFAFKLSLIHFILRPVLGSFFCFTLLLVMLQKFRGHKAAPSLRYLLAIPLLFALWANLHPSFILGLFLLVLCIVGAIADLFILRTRTLSERDTNTMIGVCILSALATLFNPYGFALHKSIFALGESTFFMALHSEWQPLNVRDLSGQLFQGIAALIIMLTFALGRPKSVRCFELLLFLVFGHFALTSQRFLPYFGIVSSLLTAPLLATLFSRIPKPWNKIVSLPALRSCVSPVTLGACFCVLLLVPGTTLSTHHVPLYTGEYGPPRHAFPYNAIADLSSKVAEPTSLFSITDWGGFITLMGEGKIKAVVDDRNTMLGEPIYRHYLEALKTPEQCESFALSLGASYLLLPNSPKLDQHFESYFSNSIVYRDDIAVLIRLS